MSSSVLISPLRFIETLVVFHPAGILGVCSWMVIVSCVIGQAIGSQMEYISAVPDYPQPVTHSLE